MIVCNYRKKGININHIWFADKIPDAKNNLALINYFHGIPQRQIEDTGIVWEQYSLITNLYESEEILYQKIRKNFRYEIRRTNKENVTARVILAKDVEKEGTFLQSFAYIYNQMYANKGMKVTFNLPLINAYIKSNAILFTVAYYDQEPLVFHSYIIDGNRCRFFYSASPFRVEKELASEIGRMNKSLHWHDILWFKQHGYEFYDWGGIASPVNPNGIDNFKLGFGGDLVSYYNIIYGKNYLVRLLLSVYKKINHA